MASFFFGQAQNSVSRLSRSAARLLWASRARALAWLDDPTGILYVATLATGEVLALSSVLFGDQVGRDVMLHRGPGAEPELVRSAWAAYARRTP